MKLFQRASGIFRRYIPHLAIIIIIMLILFLHKSYNNNNNNNDLKNKIIHFFEEMGYKYQPPAPIWSKSYGPNNDYYIYSTAQVIKENSVMVQPIVRKEDQGGSSNPFRLSNFNMISVKSEGNMSKLVDTNIKFMRDFCGIDMKKIGCVSISGNNRFGFDGIEKYIGHLENEGINKKNIYIRDADEAVNEGEGDGYWKEPDFDKYNSWSISFYYQLENGANIAEYKNHNKWLEIGEIGETEMGIGLERIKYVMERNRR